MKHHKKPPHIILWLLSKLKSYEEDFCSCGDFMEYYNYLYTTEHWLKATWVCWINIIVMMTGYIKRAIVWRLFLLKENIKFTLRSFVKYKIYSILNVTGLAIGITCAIFIMLWVQDELSYNQFHKNIDEIYWISEWVNHNGISSSVYGSVTALGPTLKKEYPEVVNVARCMNGTSRFLIQYKDRSFFEEVKFGDFSFFEIFSFPVVRGRAQSENSGANGIMLSQKIARKYFGSENPVGKILTLDRKYNLRVAGVFEDIKRTSTIQFDLIVPLEFGNQIFSKNFSFSWDDDGNQTYLQLRRGVDYHALNAKLLDVYKKRDQDKHWAVAYPFKKFYLEKWGRGRKTMVQVFTLVAILILCIACINFVNLSTSRSVTRAKEVGLRKVVGAQPRDLIRQFLWESTLYAIMATLIALAFVILALPIFAETVGKPLTLESVFNTNMLLGIICITIVTGLASGIYPAFFLSSLKLSNILRDSGKPASRKTLFRKLLVVAQYVVSICLIICSLTVFKQVSYLRNANWGFDKEALVQFSLEGSLKKDYRQLKNELLKNPRLVSATASFFTPGGVWAGNSGWEWEGKDPDFHLWSRVFNTDPDFVRTFNLKMAAGKFFSSNSSNKNQVVINETFAKKLNFNNPVGKYIKEKSINDNQPSQIIGVIKNYHIAPFNIQIAPLIIFPNFKWGDNYRNYRYMFVKIRPENPSQTISYIEKTLKKYNPDYPFEYQFYDTYFNNLYNREKMLDKVVRAFTVLAILISCLGLFGLASFSSEQRKKEIGIRKVLGASVTGILFLLSKQFLKLVVISIITAIPIAYYLVQNWLNSYAYRIDPNLWLFIIPGLAALGIALATIFYQIMRAALANPVDSIQCE